MKETIEDLITVMQGLNPPEVREIEEDKQRVDLNELQLGSLIKFKGIHPASNYIIELVEVNGKRKVRLWYIGGGGLDTMGNAACFFGPGLGCFEFDVDFILADDYKTGKNQKGVLEVGKQYMLPEFKWYDQELQLPQRLYERVEGYKKISLLTRV